MITKEELKKTLDLVFKLKGSLTLNYISPSKIETPKDCYNLYYGGCSKMEIYSDLYRDGSCNLSTYEELGGLDVVIDRIYANIQDDISPYIMQAINNIGGYDTTLKCFEDEPEMHEKFKNEVLRLKNK
jgi:hypothetical protein